jgi:hypothetical protein
MIRDWNASKLHPSQAISKEVFMATQIFTGTDTVPRAGLRQLGGILAITGVVVVMAAAIGIQGETPDLTFSIGETRAWFADNGQQYLVGDYLIALGFLLMLVPSVVIINSVLSEAEGAPGVWSRLSLLSFFLYLLWEAITSIGMGALALGIQDIDSDGTIRALQYVQFYGETSVSLIMLALYFVGASLVILKTGVFARWLGALGLLFAGLAIVAAAAPIDGDANGPLVVLGFIPFLGSMFWFLAFGINLLRPSRAA